MASITSTTVDHTPVSRPGAMSPGAMSPDAASRDGMSLDAMRSDARSDAATEDAQRAAAIAHAMVDEALAGDRGALAALVSEITPVVHARTTRALWRRRSQSRGADRNATLEDLTQDVFVELFRDGGRVLRAWRPHRGLSLKSFVGLVAEQRVAAMFRSRRRHPYAEDLAIDDEGCDATAADAQSPEACVLSREELEGLLEEVRARLSPLGLELFYALVIREESVASVCARMSMSTAAVHAWSSRLKRLVHELAAQDRVRRSS